MEQRLREFIHAAEKSGYQIVIFETGAGIDFAVLALARVVEDIVIVVEPDETSQSAALDLHGELRRKAKSLHFVINKMPKPGEDTGHAAQGIKCLPSLPFDHKMQVKFARNAPSILHTGFRGMRYRRYAGGVARELYGVNAMMPTWWDSVAERTVTRVLLRFFGYGSLFLLAVVTAFVVLAQFLA